jgi:hypothetical protein
VNSALGNPAQRRIEIGAWWLRTSSGAQNRSGTQPSEAKTRASEFRRCAATPAVPLRNPGNSPAEHAESVL